MGTMIEADQPLLMSLRLRIELGRITEVESIYSKAGGGGPNNIADMDRPHVLTASAPPRANLAPGAIDAFAMDCMTQFKLGYYFVVQSIHGRRYPVIDQERGVVCGN